MFELVVGKKYWVCALDFRVGRKSPHFKCEPTEVILDTMGSSDYSLKRVGEKYTLYLREDGRYLSRFTGDENMSESDLYIFKYLRETREEAIELYNSKLQKCVQKVKDYAHSIELAFEKKNL